jgi:hypothetical protein
MKALRSFSFFKSKDKGSSGEASSPRSGESTPTSPTNSASLSNLFPGDGTPMGVDPNGVQNADGPPVGVDPNSLEEKQVKFAAATAAEAPAVQEQSSPGRTDSKKLDRKDSAGTLKKTKSDYFGDISDLQHDTLRAISLKSSKPFELLSKIKQDKFDTVLATSGVQLLVWARKSEADMKERKCVLKCSLANKTLNFDISGTGIGCAMDAVEGLIKLEVLASNAGKTGLGNQFRVCLKDKGWMDVSLENELVCDAILIGLMGTVVKCCPQGPLAVSVRSFDPASKPRPATSGKETSGKETSGKETATETAAVAPPAPLDAVLSFEDHLSSERGYEVVVCVPVKSGKDIKRRRGFIRCAANDRNCFVDVAGAKDNAPSATISFDLADLQAVAKGTNKDTKPSWNLDPDRIIRFSIVARPELLFEFERDSRDTFHQSFSDAVKNRLNPPAPTEDKPSEDISSVESALLAEVQAREAEQLAQDEANRIAADAAEKLEKEEAARLAAVEAERLTREEAIRAQVESERLAAEEKARLQREQDRAAVADADTLLSVLDERLASPDGFELTVCLPNSKAGKEPRRRKGIMKIGAVTKTCDLEIFSGKDGSNALLSFDLDDISSVDIDNVPALPGLDPDRALRLVVTSRPDLIFEFGHVLSRGAFNQKFVEIRKQRIESFKAREKEAAAKSEEAQRLQQENDERLRAAQEREEKRAAELLAQQQEEERRALEESERKKKEESDRKSKQEADLKAKQDADREAAEEAKLAQEEAQRQEALGHAREEEQRITAAAAERTQSQITSLKAEIARIQSLLAAKTLEVSQAQQRNADVVASMQQYKIDSAATDRVRTELTSLKSKTVAFQASALIPSAVTDNQRELTDKLVALKISVGTSEQQIERLQTAKNILVAENSMSELMVAKLEKDCSDKRRDLDNLDTATVISGHSTLARNSPQKSDQGVPIQAQPASPGLLSWVTFGLVGSGSSTP